MIGFAAVLMLPIAMAAASSLLTPIGYQTNLRVMAPGGYQFSDCARAGWPVTLLVMGTSVTVISLPWL